MSAREIIAEHLGHSDFDENTLVGALTDSLTLLAICYDLEKSGTDLVKLRSELPADATLGQFLELAGHEL